MCIHSRVYGCVRSQRTPWGTWHSPLALWVLGIKHQEAWVPSEHSLLAQCMALKKVRVGDHNQVFMIMQASSLVCID